MGGRSTRELKRSDLAALRILLSRSCDFDRASLVAEQTCFGLGVDARPTAGVVCRVGDTLAGVAVHAGEFLRILAVDPEFRGQGIGSRLLDELCQSGSAQGCTSLQTLAQPGNYLAPGVDVENQETVAWLSKRGFVRGREHTNLRVDVHDDSKISEDALMQWRARAPGYAFERLKAIELPRWQKRVAQSFSKPWAFEIALACEQDPSGAHVAYAPDGSPASFAVHDGNNAGLGWFGPTGTFEEHRGKGLAGALLLSCLLDVRDAGHPFCEVAWIGPREFYEKVSGVKSERRFVVMTKNLRGSF